MMNVQGICRCGNKMTVLWAEDPVIEEFDVMTCTHCDRVCILNPKSCTFCKAMADTSGDAEYYGYNK